jgi:hypothetical protein
MSWKNAFFTILGGFIASLSGIIVEELRERKELRNKHFEDIKQECLEPILNKLYELRGYFEINESIDWKSLCSHDHLNYLKSNSHWWDNFSFERCADKLLYEDLKKHYSDLYEKLQIIENWIRNNYKDYLITICSLLELIENDSEFKEIEKELLGEVSDPKGFLLKATMFSLLSIDKSYWPNVYSKVKPKLDKLIHLQNKFYNTNEAQKLRSTINYVTSMIDECATSIKEISLEAKLKGKCRYIK